MTAPDPSPPTVLTEDEHWPARAYIYGTWGYALDCARDLAQSYRQRLWLYGGVLDGERVWVVSWDPKP